MQLAKLFNFTGNIGIFVNEFIEQMLLNVARFIIVFCMGSYTFYVLI